MPGHIHPADAPRSNNRAEALVWKALRDQLPEGWQAWHSLKVRTTRGEFGEGDFVIADPNRGILVLEVKGGKVTQAAGRWFYEGGRPMDEPPLDQAHRFAGKLAWELERVWPHAHVPRGVACCFPETPAENRPTNADLRDLIIDEIELGDIVPALRRAFDATVTPGNAPRDTCWLDALTQLWGDSWQPRVGLLGRARLREQSREALNEQQLSALRGLEKLRRMIVSGGAGTGKSTVAMRIAEQRAWEGKSVRYLCFTLPLARWVDEQLALPRDSAGIDARAQTVHALALELATAWDLDVPRAPTGSDWNRVLQAVAEQPTDRPCDRPDVLLIDEAQSFSDEAWALVDRLRAQEGWLWIFRDPAQAFWENRSIPPRYTDGIVEYELQRQERMPRSLHAIARAYKGGSLDAAIDAYDPDTFRVVRCNGDLRPLLTREIDRLLELGFRPEHIGIVTLVGQTASQLFGADHLGPHRVAKADHDAAPTSVVLDTFLRFQGLDRPLLLLCEGHLDASQYRYPERMHMALTRASTAAILLAADPLWTHDPILPHLQQTGRLHIDP